MISRTPPLSLNQGNRLLMAIWRWQANLYIPGREGFWSELPIYIRARKISALRNRKEWGSLCLWQENLLKKQRYPWTFLKKNNPSCLFHSSNLYYCVSPKIPILTYLYKRGNRPLITLRQLSELDTEPLWTTLPQNDKKGSQGWRLVKRST